VLSVDGREVDRKSIEHGTPVTFPEDESFDIGRDTRTGVVLLEYRYDPPLKFNGKIDKVTFDLKPEQTAEGCRARERLDTMKRVLIVAAVCEVATGAGLLILPTLVVRLLLGVEPSGVAVLIARVTGIALVGLGIACWPARMNPFRGMLTYNALMTSYLAWVGVQGEWVGPMLWMVLVLHALITILLGGVWFMGSKAVQTT